MVQAVLSIDEQVKAMKAAWPQFVVRKRDRHAQSVQWVGEVRPQYSKYKLDVRYEWGWPPKVRVLSPELIRLPDNPEGQLPHVYPPADDPTLCLFDPREGEWAPTMTIASTIVPWSFDWIACYEHWLMTKRWTGGGRHAISID